MLPIHPKVLNLADGPGMETHKNTLVDLLGTWYYGKPNSNPLSSGNQSSFHDRSSLLHYVPVCGFDSCFSEPGDQIRDGNRHDLDLDSQWMLSKVQRFL